MGGETHLKITHSSIMAKKKSKANKSKKSKNKKSKKSKD